MYRLTGWQGVQTGRTDDDGQTPVYSRDYAIDRFNTAMVLLHWPGQAHVRDLVTFVSHDGIAGREDAEIAAVHGRVHRSDGLIFGHFQCLGPSPQRAIRTA